MAGEEPTAAAAWRPRRSPGPSRAGAPRDGGRILPRRGLPLAVILGATISALVALLLGGLTAVQLRREERREVAVREGLLAESLVPLSEEIEQASDLGELERLLVSCRLAEVSLGRLDYNLVIRDSGGRVLLSATGGGEELPPEDSLQASLTIRSQALPTETGTVMVWQDRSRLSADMSLRRRDAWIDIGATGFAVIVVVQLAIFLLVSRPLHRLLTAVERFEQGYAARFRSGGLTRELNVLAWRLHGMSVGLTNSARLLVAAHRRATESSKLRRAAIAGPPLATPLEIQDSRLAMGSETMRRYFADRCSLLERSSPGTPAARELALEVWERDAVEAERCGEMELRARLENCALAVLAPTAFERVSRNLESLISARAPWRAATVKEISSALTADGVAHLTIQHRAKHAAGVWRKMQERRLSLEEVHDLVALRIIVPELDDCYLALDTVHRLFEPEPFRFKDYVANPKTNGYQSLHTSVRDRDGFVFELQIRTVDMHRAAEEGIAAHWRYRARKPCIT